MDRIRMLELRRKLTENDIKNLNDPDVNIRLKAAKSLGFCVNVYALGAVEPLINLLNDPSEDLRKTSAEALGSIGDEKAVEPLIKLLDDKSERIKLASIEALGKIGDKKAVKSLIITLEDTSEDLCKESAKALGLIGDEKAVEPLIKLLDDKSERIKLASIEALGKIGDKKAVKPLIKKLNDPSEDLRKTSAEALGFIGDEKAVEPLIKLLEDTSVDICIASANALGKIRDERAVDPLIKSLKVRSSDIRRASIESLANIGDIRAVEPLLNALNNRPKTLHGSMILALGKIGDERAVKPLINRLNDPSNKIRANISCALGLIGDERAVEPLIKTLNSTSERFCGNSAYALGLLGDERAVEPLIKTLNRKSPRILKCSIISLGKLGDVRAVEPISKFLRDESKDICICSAEALGKISDDHAAEPLIKALNNPEEQEVLNSISNSLNKIAENKGIEYNKLYENYLEGKYHYNNSLNDKEDKNSNQKLENYKVTINPSLLKSLLNNLNDDSYKVRAKTAEVLGDIGDKSVVKHLKMTLNDENKKVIQSAKIALEKFGIKDSIPPISGGYIINNDQKKFYQYLLSEFENNNFPDIDGNIGYIYAYLSELEDPVYDKKSDINIILDHYNLIEKHYGQYKAIKDRIIFDKVDYYKSIGCFNKSFELKKQIGISLQEALSYAYFTNNDHFNGNDLLNIFDCQVLTNFGNKYIEKIGRNADKYLEQFKQENKKNLFEYFMTFFDFGSNDNPNFNPLKKFFPHEEEFLECVNHYNNNESKGSFIYGITIYSFDENHSEVYVPYILIKALKNQITYILRESENDLRVEMGIPKIGEGWVSETELYYKIKEAFPKERVIHHGRPSWLGLQHLDIYFPEKNVAIEYQGLQHDQPVEFFGGKDKHQHQKELDEKKLKKCEDNKCKLIFVYPNYDLKDIIKKIEELF